MHTFIYELCPVAFKHFRVSLSANVINFYLERSLYIDIYKNIVSYFNTVEMLFVIHFGKRIEDQWWLREGLGRCDR